MSDQSESLFPAARKAVSLASLPTWGDEAQDAAVAELDRAENALRNWLGCYPEDVFIPLTDAQQKEVVAVLKANGWTPDALYAHWGRHIVKCITEAMS